jgi:hypothetical protein
MAGIGRAIGAGEPIAAARGPRATYATRSSIHHGPRITGKLEPDACKRGRPMLRA